jgi:hypothetical protein
MIRNFKVLGLAFMAVLAMSAVAASAASAQLGKITSDGPVTLTGSQAGEEALTAFSSSVKCPGSTYTGHKVNSTALIASGSTEVTVTPHYVNCTSPVNMNGCDYRIYDATTTAANTYSVKADLVCKAGSAGVLISGAFGCNTTIPPQTGLAGAHITGTPAVHRIDLVGTITGIKANNVCFGETKTAQLHLNTTITGHNAEGKATGVTISD